MSRVLNLLVTHQAPDAVARSLKWWDGVKHQGETLIAYGGTAENFEKLAHPHRVFVDDPRLRVVEQKREKQSYAEIYRLACEWAEGRGFSHVYVVEFDQLPLVANVHDRLLERMEAERADVLGHHVGRIDGTNHPHYLYHITDPEFLPFFQKISVRDEPGVILSQFGTGSFWTYEAFRAVALQPTEIACYHELWVASVAHHLGYRLRDLGDQNQFIWILPDPWVRIDRAREAGMWTIHPIKTITESLLLEAPG